MIACLSWIRGGNLCLAQFSAAEQRSNTVSEKVIKHFARTEHRDNVTASNVATTPKKTQRLMKKFILHYKCFSRGRFIKHVVLSSELGGRGQTEFVKFLYTNKVRIVELVTT